MEDNTVLNWDDIYTIGHQKIDGEHQRLFELAKEVTKCKNNKDEIIAPIKELIKYTKLHFTNEEQYMKSINYLFLDEHKLLHAEMIQNVNNLLQQISILTTEEIKEKLSILINKNFIHHILTEDKRVHHYRRDNKELKDIFSWKQKYEIENFTIDNEHQKLFDIAAKSLNYNSEGLGRKEYIKSTISELYNYMRIHFDHEEEYMHSINYEGYSEHKVIHEDIIEQLNDFIKKIPTLSTEKLERMIIEYMDVWLINHILTEDKKIIASLEGITPS